MPIARRQPQFAAENLMHAEIPRASNTGFRNLRGAWGSLLTFLPGPLPSSHSCRTCGLQSLVYMGQAHQALGQHYPVFRYFIHAILCSARAIPLGSVLDRKSNKKVYTTISKILDQLAKCNFAKPKSEPPGGLSATRKLVSNFRFARHSRADSRLPH